MGKAVYEATPVGKETYAQAERVLQWPVDEVSFRGPEERLNQTAYTQPALLTASIALWRAMPQRLRDLAGVVAGHSLGEYSALVAADSISFEEAVHLVYRRGIFMQEAVPSGNGKMAAVLGLGRAIVAEICREASSEGIVSPANFNAPNQVVISGERLAVERAMHLAKGAAAKKVVELAVSVPSHTSLMHPASRRLAAELEKVTFRDLTIPLINNLKGQKVTTGSLAKSGLAEQVSSPLLWEESIETIWKMGFRHFIEVGPGRILSGLTKRMHREAQIFSIEDPTTMDKACAAILS